MFQHYLYHVFLHACGIVTSKNRQQLVIRYEEEPGEGVSLGIKIIVKTLLTFLQTINNKLKLVQSISSMAGLENFRVLCCISHNLYEEITYKTWLLV